MVSELARGPEGLCLPGRFGKRVEEGGRKRAGKLVAGRSDLIKNRSRHLSPFSSSAPPFFRPYYHLKAPYCLKKCPVRASVPQISVPTSAQASAPPT